MPLRLVGPVCDRPLAGAHRSGRSETGP